MSALQAGLSRLAACQADASTPCGCPTAARPDACAWAPCHAPAPQGGHAPRRRFHTPARPSTIQTAVAWCSDAALEALPRPMDSSQPWQLTRRIKYVQSPGELAYLWHHQHHRFNQIHTCASLMRLAHFPAHSTSNPETSQLIDELCQHASTLTHLMGPRESSSVLWAAASLRHPADSAWIDHMADVALELLPQSTGQDIGMTLWALGRMGHHPGLPWLNTLTAHLQQRLYTLDTQALVNVVWALGTLRYQPSPAWLAACMRVLHARLPELTPQGHANAIWAFAVMGQPCSPVWATHLSSLLTSNLHAFSMAELSMLLFALGRMGPRTRSQASQPSQSLLPTHVLEAVSAALAEGMSDLNVPQAGCMLWGLAHLKYHPGQQLLDSFFTHTQPLLQASDAQTLTNMALALQRMLHLLPPSVSSQPQHQHAQHQQQAGGGREAAVEQERGSSQQQLPFDSTSSSGVSGVQLVLYPPAAGLHQPLPSAAPAGLPGSPSSHGHASPGPQPTNPPLHIAHATTSDMPQPGAYVGGQQQPEQAQREQRQRRQPCLVPGAWAHAYLAASGPMLTRMNGHACAMCAYSLSQLGVHPDAAWRQAFLRAISVQLEAGQLSPVDIMCIAASLARWRVSPPAMWAMSFLEGFRATICSGRSGPYESSRTLLALARLQLLPDPDTVEAIRLQFDRQAEHVTAADMAILRRAVALLPQCEHILLGIDSGISRKGGRGTAVPE